MERKNGNKKFKGTKEDPIDLECEEELSENSENEETGSTITVSSTDSLPEFGPIAQLCEIFLEPIMESEALAHLWLRQHHMLLEDGYSLCLTQTDILTAMKNGHDVIVSCGRCYARSLPPQNIFADNSKSVPKPEESIFKRTRNSDTPYDSKNSRKFFRPRTWNKEWERDNKLEITALRNFHDMNLPSNLENSDLMEDGKVETTPIANTKSSKQEYFPVPRKNKLQRTISNFGFDFTEESNPSQR